MADICPFCDHSWEWHGGDEGCDVANDMGGGHYRMCECPAEAGPNDGSEGFTTKDSGERAEFKSGMVRDTQEGKARFDLLLPLDVPYHAQFLTRVAELMERGAQKYSERNWEQADSGAELERFRASAIRHLMQWISEDRSEDHAAAVVYNLLGYETTKYKMER